MRRASLSQLDAVRAKKPATYADVVALPDHLVGEIVDGELYASPRPASLHARASSVLAADLGSMFDRGRGGPGGWLILVEPELHIVGQVMVPDLAGWRRERMPEMPDTPFFELAPDWICEVVSPSTGKLDRVKKMPQYARASVRHSWLIDPLQKSLEVYRLSHFDSRASWELLATHSDEEKVRAEPFDAIELELELAALWAR